MLNFEIMIDFTKYDLEKAKYIASKGGKSVLESMIENVQNLDLVNKAELIKSIKTEFRHHKESLIRFQFHMLGMAFSTK